MKKQNFESEEAARLSTLARNIASGSFSPQDIDAWEDELGQRISEHLSYGRLQILSDALSMTVSAYDGARSESERTEVGLAVERLVVEIEHHATTREIYQPRPEGGRKSATAHLFAIPIMVHRSETPSPRKDELAAMSSSILELIERSLMDVVAPPPEHKASLRILDYVYTQKQLEALSWDATRRMILRALCHFSGTETTAEDLGQSGQMDELKGEGEIRYLIGVYSCDEANPVFHSDDDTCDRLQAWSFERGRELVAAYLNSKGIGDIDDVSIELPYDVCQARRVGLSCQTQFNFIEELANFSPYVGPHARALIDINETKSGTDIVVKLFSAPTTDPDWDYIGQLTRHVLLYEEEEVVLDGIMFGLQKIGVVHAQMSAVPEGYSVFTMPESQMVH